MPKFWLLLYIVVLIQMEKGFGQETFGCFTQIASSGVFYRGAIAKGQKNELAGARTLVSG